MFGVTHFFRAGERVELAPHVKGVDAYWETEALDLPATATVVGYFYWQTNVNAMWYYAVETEDGRLLAGWRGEGTDRIHIVHPQSYTPPDLGLVRKALASPRRTAKSGSNSVEFATDAQMDECAAAAAAYRDVIASGGSREEAQEAGRLAHAAHGNLI